jgi:plasmid stability protein
MAGTKSNLTITLDADILREARVYAARKDTSVNQLVREYLEGLVAQETRHAEKLKALDELMERGIGLVGEITWNRDDLYRRSE